MTYEETLIVAKQNIKDSLSNEGELVFEFLPIESKSAENIIDAAVAAFSEQDLLRVQSVSFRMLQLFTVPNGLRYFKNLVILDLSYTNIKTVPPWIIEFRKLQRLDLLGTQIKKLPPIIKKMDWLRQLDLRHTALSLSRRNPYKHIGFKKKIYSLLYKHLDMLQNRIDLCNWHEAGELAGVKQFACMRSNYQCCKHEWECVNLCEKAVKLLRTMRAAKKRTPLRTTARRYYRMRIVTELLCKLLNIPLKIRTGKAESFDKEAGEFVNVKIKRWYDGIELYPLGVYPGKM